MSTTSKQDSLDVEKRESKLRSHSSPPFSCPRSMPRDRHRHAMLRWVMFFVLSFKSSQVDVHVHVDHEADLSIGRVMFPYARKRWCPELEDIIHDHWNHDRARPSLSLSLSLKLGSSLTRHMSVSPIPRINPRRKKNLLKQWHYCPPRITVHVMSQTMGPSSLWQPDGRAVGMRPI